MAGFTLDGVGEDGLILIRDPEGGLRCRWGPVARDGWDQPLCFFAFLFTFAFLFAFGFGFRLPRAP